MSLYEVMRTSTSGMSAQSSRISAVSENVANANTNGYKAVHSEFSSLMINSGVGSYNSGSVQVSMRRGVADQGTLTATNSVTDLAIQGNGFFMVQNPAGETFMTRAGSFVPDSNNKLVNAAGFILMGYPMGQGQSGIVVNGTTGMVPITVNNTQLSAAPSTTGTFKTNLPSTAAVVVAAQLPSANLATSAYTDKSSIVAYGNQGQEITLDVYYSKTATDTWQVAVFNRADAAPTGGFPYATAPLATQTLQFDPANGQLASASAKSVSLSVPGGQNMTFDLTGTSQLATNYSVISSDVNGNKASTAKLVEIAKDGTVFVAYDNGTRQAAYRIPIASVASPDNLDSLTGNVFSTTAKSGNLHIGFPQDPGLGTLDSGVVEQSTADIASEFTDMIDAQRGYTANSKVFQTGAELMDVLVNLKR